MDCREASSVPLKDAPRHKKVNRGEGKIRPEREVAKMNTSYQQPSETFLCSQLFWTPA